SFKSCAHSTHNVVSLENYTPKKVSHSLSAVKGDVAQRWSPRAFWPQIPWLNALPRGIWKTANLADSQKIISMPACSQEDLRKAPESYKPN
ncbi:hypothetical protein LEMLEM_LOCUS4403, partial [Lemmus lemmus]